ncbi:receptor-type tyrosine-protein phosphatase F-like isoform X2 [Zophobas morio]|uniref:receptor-type tyrosine-protein phosphatase F-like isoform X2 n=1 Tax=Zophobas morio TaxID=2755281 RepID=UPI0030827B49
MCNNMRLTVLSSYKLLFLCAVIFQQANAGLPTRKKSGYQFSQQEYLLSSDFWENDDWIIKESSSLLTRPHFEAHFEEFVIKKRKEIFVNFEKSYSFSVKGTTDIVFFVSAESSQFYYPYQINDEKIWTTFTVSVKDGMLFIYENYTTLIQQVTYVPKTLIIETPIPANFKIYDYEYKEATSDTKGQLYINKLRIPDSGEVYLILSVSMCDTCDLIATYKNTNCFMHSSNDHNTERWASYKIKINPNIYKEVILARRNHYSNNAGYWKLHLRLTNRAIESVPEVRKCDGFTRRPISTLSPSIRVLDNVVPEVRNYDYFTRHRISSTLPPSFRGTITFSNISPPTSNDSTKAYFVFSKNGLIKSTNEVIAYALILLEDHLDIQSKNGSWGSWDGTNKTWPSIPKDSLQLTPNLWNPFTNEVQTCNFIIGAANNCCKEHCYNEPLKPNTKYWLMVRALTNQAYNDSAPLSFHTDNILTETTPVSTTVLPETSQSNNFTSPTVQTSASYPSLDTITFQKISPPTSNDSTKAYFVLSKNDLVNSTDEIIAYALFLLEEHVDIQSKNGSWNGTLKNWPSTPKNSLQLTPNFWNPFLEDRHICNFIIGASSGCCRVHCYNEPLKPSTSYWLMVRTLTNQAYNDSPLLFFQTASEDSYHYNTYYISVGVLILVILVTVVLVYIIYKIRRRNNQATITQEEDMMLIVNQKPLETTVIDFNSLQNHCSQPTFLTSLKIQFNSISDPVPHSSCRIGLQRKNINKNRDRNRIIPYDTNRVVLKPMEGVGTEDYINASYIDGYDRSKAYIACQSPKFCTIKDFWRMIWQENVSVIIMATNFFEHKKRMCAEYWPQSESEVYEYGEITIKLLRETTFELYAYQELEIAYGDESKNIRHIHFMWSFDDSNMFYPNDVLPVVKLIRQQYENSSGPIVFHSGYGTGGVGILILCDLALQMIRKDNKVDFFSLTRTLRDQRASMITNMEHYIFSHLLMNEYSLEYSNPFQYSIGQNIKHDDIKQQFNYLETLRQYDNIFQEVSLQYCIPRHPFESVIVARYGQRRKYLISREPKEEQLIDFWKMVARKSIGWVLFLNKELPLSTRVTGSIEVVNITRKQVVNTAYGLMTEASLLIYNKISKKKIHDHKLYIFQFNNWKENQLLPNSVCNFISVINYIHSKTAKEKLVLVSCSDGFTACGLFVVFSYIVEKYENEVEIDVCNAIRLARRSGRSFVSRTKQLTFIYKCIRDYIENYDKYQQIINSK